MALADGTRSVLSMCENFRSLKIWNVDVRTLELAFLESSGARTLDLKNFRTCPEGHSAMDKALACHAGGQGLNPDITKDF